MLDRQVVLILTGCLVTGARLIDVYPRLLTPHQA